MAKYKIFVDTAADMPQELADKHGIGIINFMSVFGEEAFVAGVELTNSEFYKKLEESKDIPTTSQTPYAEFYDILKKASDENDTVIYFTISSKASGQHNTACMVREEILEENPKADIRIVDTMSFSVFITSAAIYAKELIDAGEDIDTAIEKAKKHIESYTAYILVDTLKYLEKGGRINKTTAIIGSMLDIKPVLTIKDGLVESAEKLRGRKKIYKKLIELIRENPDFDEENPDFMIAHSSVEYCNELKEALKEEFGIEDIKYCLEFGPIVGTHIGPGVIGVLFKLKK